jgi:hypothetical protein
LRGADDATGLGFVFVGIPWINDHHMIEAFDEASPGTRLSRAWLDRSSDI